MNPVTFEWKESGDPDLISQAWYNVGNAFYRQEDLQQSLDAYKQALRIDPDDQDAKHNLEVALLEQEQQQHADGGTEGCQTDVNIASHVVCPFLLGPVAPALQARSGVRNSLMRGLPVFFLMGADQEGENGC